MAQIIINDDDGGGEVRTSLNGMFKELYSSIVTAVKIPNQAANLTYNVPANTTIHNIYMVATAGAPVVRVGTTPNGNEISGPDDIVVTADGNPMQPEKYFGAATPIYFTIVGGTISIRINAEFNFY